MANNQSIRDEIKKLGISMEDVATILGMTRPGVHHKLLRSELPKAEQKEIIAILRNAIKNKPHCLLGKIVPCGQCNRCGFNPSIERLRKLHCKNEIAKGDFDGTLRLGQGGY